MKQFIIYFLAPSITLLLAVMKLPGWNNFMKKYPVTGNLLGWFTVVGNVIIYYFLLPYRKYEDAQKKKWDMMEKLADEFCNEFKEYDFSVHIMFAKTRYCFYIEPSKKKPGKRKFTWIGKVFEQPRELAGRGVSPELRFTINQTAYGKAYRGAPDTDPRSIKHGIISPGKSTEKNMLDNNLTREQIELMHGIVNIFSCPLVSTKKVGDKYIKKVFGVLNVESRVENFEKLIADPALKKMFFAKITELSRIFNTLHVF